MHKLYAFLTACSLLLIFGFKGTSETAQPLFEGDELIEMTLKADFSMFAKDRYKSPQYHPATLEYEWQGSKHTAEIKIKARGRFRRDICDIPPIKMNFKKKKPTPLFAGQNTLKVVHQCKEDEPEAVLKEYYVYKAYNLLTDKSFRVRLVKITYVDTKEQRPDQTQYAFFIEDDDLMAERHGASTIDESVELHVPDVHREHQTVVHLFNYMIANRDSRVADRQNVKVITGGPGNPPIVVPYDFDNSGIVDASYTKVRGDDKPTYFRRREFQSICRTQEEFQAAFEKFRSIQEKLFMMYENSPYLSEDTKKETLKYYKNFYKMIKKKKVLSDVFLASCNQ